MLAIIACIVLAVCFLTDPVASRTEQPSDPAVSNTEATPDPADTAPEEPAQPTEQDDNLSAEQEAMKDELSAAEEADNSALDELIGKAVLDHYADAVQPGQIHVEAMSFWQRTDAAQRQSPYICSFCRRSTAQTANR